MRTIQLRLHWPNIKKHNNKIKNIRTLGRCSTVFIRCQNAIWYLFYFIYNMVSLFNLLICWARVLSCYRISWYKISCNGVSCYRVSCCMISCYRHDVRHKIDMVLKLFAWSYTFMISASLIRISDVIIYWRRSWYTRV